MSSSIAPLSRTDARRVIVFLEEHPDFGGGSERMRLALCWHAVRHSHDVWLVHAALGHTGRSARRVCNCPRRSRRVGPLRTSGRLISWPGRSSQSLPDTLRKDAMLARYFVSERFDALLAHAYLTPLLPRSTPKAHDVSARDYPALGTAWSRIVARDSVVLGDWPLDDERHSRRGMASGVQWRATANLPVSTGSETQR